MHAQEPDTLTRTLAGSVCMRDENNEERSTEFTLRSVRGERVSGLLKQVSSEIPLPTKLLPPL